MVLLEHQVKLDKMVTVEGMENRVHQALTDHL